MNTPIDNIITEPLPAETIAAIEMQAQLETIRKPREQVAREVFNTRAAELIFRFSSYINMVLSPEWKEVSGDLFNMVGKEQHGCIVGEFFVDNARMITSMSTKE